MWISKDVDLDRDPRYNVSSQEADLKQTKGPNRELDLMLRKSDSGVLFGMKLARHVSFGYRVQKNQNSSGSSANTTFRHGVNLQGFVQITCKARIEIL